MPEKYAWEDGSGLGATPAEVEASCEQHMVYLLSKHGPAFVPQTMTVKTQASKGRAVSAMQKAIRRGNVSIAVMCAHAMHGYDEKYVWRRLCTIAIEDIGIGDIRTLAAMLWVSNKSQWKKNNSASDLHVLDAVVRALCEAPKDRNACDLLVWADLAPELQEYRDWAVDKADAQAFSELKSIVFDSSENLAHRMIAMWAWCGTKKFPGARFRESIFGLGIKGPVDHLLDYPEVVPPAIPLIMRWAASKQYEGMPMAFFFIWEQAYESEQPPGPGLGDDLTIDVPAGLIGHLPPEAYDMHNSDGRAAIKYMAKANEPIRSFLSEFIDVEGDQSKVVDALGTLIFRYEGHQVFPRLEYDGSADLVEIAEFAHLQGNHIPGQLADWGMKLIEANYDFLNAVRRRIAYGKGPDGHHTETLPDAIQIPFGQ